MDSVAVAVAFACNWRDGSSRVNEFLEPIAVRVTHCASSELRLPPHPPSEQNHVAL